LTYPERLPSPVAPLDWTTISRLDFVPPDRKKFPCISLAYRAMQMGGTAPAILNAADEIAVEAFLDRRIPFLDIPKLIEATLGAHKAGAADSIESITHADGWAREYARSQLS
jgi:1-deoxy-D-xylulose-5-phosphate reductoisomerase